MLKSRGKDSQQVAWNTNTYQGKKISSLIFADVHSLNLWQDNIDTSPDFGLPTTGGNWAFAEAVTAGNAPLVENVWLLES